MNIFDVVDYRHYLRHFIENRPKLGRGEIHRMATYAQIHPSLLSQILAGTRNLSMEQGQLLGEYIGLSSSEQDYFLLLVQYQRAGTAKLQKYFKEKIEAAQKKSSELSEKIRQDKALSELEKSIFYSHWHYMMIWLACSLNDGQSVEELCSRFRLSRERVLEVLNFLTESQICSVKNSKYSMTSQSIHLERGSPHLHKHHTNWRLRSIDTIDKITSEELIYSAPMSLSKKDFQLLRKKLSDVIKEVTEVGITSPAENIACFNLDLFWFRS